MEKEMILNYINFRCQFIDAEFVCLQRKILNLLFYQKLDNEKLFNVYPWRSNVDASIK